MPISSRISPKSIASSYKRPKLKSKHIASGLESIDAEFVLKKMMADTSGFANE